MSAVSGAHDGSFAVDGIDTSSRNSKNWAATYMGQYQWIQIDLGSSYSIEKVIFTLGEGPSRAYIPETLNKLNTNLVLAASNDPKFGGAYNPSECGAAGIATHRLNVSAHQNVNITSVNSEVSGRYVRVWDGSNGGIMATEIAVFGSQGANALLDAINSENVIQVNQILSATSAEGTTVDQTAALNAAIAKRNPEIIKAILLQNQKVPDAVMDKVMVSGYDKDCAAALVGSGKPNIQGKHIDLAMGAKDATLIGKMLSADASAFNAGHVEKAIAMNDMSLAEKIMGKAKIQPNSNSMVAAVKTGNMMLVNTMITKYGGMPNADMLNEAIRMDNSQIAGLLLTKVNPNSEAYVLAAQAGNNDLFVELTDKKGLSDNRAINVAIDKNNQKILKTGLSNGGNANDALSYAVSKDKPEMVTYILGRNGVDANKALDYSIAQSSSAMFVSILNEYNGDANLALDKAVAASKRDFAVIALETGQTQPTKHLVPAIEAGHTEFAKKIVDNGGDADAGMPKAIEKDNTALVEHFIGAGASVSKPEFLSQAAAGNLNMTTMLLDAGADANHGMESSSKNGKAEIVTLLLERGGEADKGMNVASAAGHLSVVSLLIDNGGNPDLGMMSAVKENHTKVINTLVQNGADVSNPDMISTSAGKNNTEACRTMVGAGANPESGMSSAVANNAAETLKYLISEGADGNNPSYLATAAAKGCANVVPIIIDQGVDAHALNSSGGTYIHSAIQGSVNLNTVQAFLNAQVDPNIQDNQGNSALHKAAEKGKDGVDIIEALIASGADFMMENNAGKTARKVAPMGKAKSTLKKFEKGKR